MGRFHDLCQAANKANVDLHHLKEQCYGFGSTLTKGLMAYLQCPQDRAKHYLLKDPANPIPIQFVEQATYVDDAGWWCLGIGMSLTQGPFGVPGTTVFFNLVFKRVKDCFLVCCGRDRTEFTIHLNNEAEFTTFYDYVFQALKAYFENEVERFLDPRMEKTFGFCMFDRPKATPLTE
jgi:hypothetical protein